MKEGRKEGKERGRKERMMKEEKRKKGKGENTLGVNKDFLKKKPKNRPGFEK